MSFRCVKSVCFFFDWGELIMWCGMGIMRGTYTGYVIFFTDQPETKKVATNDGKLIEGAVVFTTLKRPNMCKNVKFGSSKLYFILLSLLLANWSSSCSLFRYWRNGWSPKVNGHYQFKHVHILCLASLYYKVYVYVSRYPKVNIRRIQGPRWHGWLQ